MAKKKVTKKVTKKATKKVVAKKATKKPAAVAKKATGINAPMKASAALQAVVKLKSLSRGEMMRRVWSYIKENNLQDPNDKRTIVPDATLAAVIGKKPLSMFKMTAELSKHLSA